MCGTVTAFNPLIHGLDSEAPDGIHFSTRVAEVQADIILNLACNGKVPSTLPFDRTCASNYPAPKAVQKGLLLILVLSVATVIIMLSSLLCESFELSPSAILCH